MFRSIEEDRYFLTELFSAWEGREPLEEIFENNRYSIDMFCFVFNCIERNARGDQYYIRSTRAYRDETLQAVVPSSLELAFWASFPGAPINYLWVRDGLITWHRDRSSDRALVGVEVIQEFIGHLNVEL